MHRRDFLTTLAGAGLLSACGAIEPIPDPNSPQARRARIRLMNTVLYARKAGLLRHHMGPSLRPWATNATLTLARAGTKGEHDLVLNHDRMVDRALHRYHAPPPEARMVRFTDPIVRIKGSDGSFTFTTQIIDITGTLWLRERYELWLSDQGWLIVKGRRWPLKERKGGDTTRFGMMEWSSRDSLIDGARARRKHELHVRRLLAGWRFKDAWEAAQKGTVNSGLDNSGLAKRWALCGEVAVELGLARDAMQAYKKALELDAFVKTAQVKAADDARAMLGK